MFVKAPGAQNKTPWHQDQPYWPVHGRQVLSTWFAMDPVTLATGGLEYVRGSHDWNRVFHPESFRNDPAQAARMAKLGGEKIPDIDAARDKYECLSWDMQPGDVLIHHGMCIHGAPANSSRDHAAARLRRALDRRRCQMGPAPRHPGNDPRPVPSADADRTGRPHGLRGVSRYVARIRQLTLD